MAQNVIELIQDLLISSVHTYYNRK